MPRQTFRRGGATATAASLTKSAAAAGRAIRDRLEVLHAKPVTDTHARNDFVQILVALATQKPATKNGSVRRRGEHSQTYQTATTFLRKLNARAVNAAERAHTNPSVQDACVAMWEDRSENGQRMFDTTPSVLDAFRSTILTLSYGRIGIYLANMLKTQSFLNKTFENSQSLEWLFGIGGAIGGHYLHKNIAKQSHMESRIRNALLKDDGSLQRHINAIDHRKREFSQQLHVAKSERTRVERDLHKMVQELNRIIQEKTKSTPDKTAEMERAIQAFREEHADNAKVLEQFDRWLPSLAVKADSAVVSWLQRWTGPVSTAPASAPAPAPARTRRHTPQSRSRSRRSGGGPSPLTTAANNVRARLETLYAKPVTDTNAREDFVEILATLATRKPGADFGAIRKGSAEYQDAHWMLTKVLRGRNRSVPHLPNARASLRDVCVAIWEDRSSDLLFDSSPWKSSSAVGAFATALGAMGGLMGGTILSINTEIFSMNAGIVGGLAGALAGNHLSNRFANDWTTAHIHDSLATNAQLKQHIDAIDHSKKEFLEQLRLTKRKQEGVEQDLRSMVHTLREAQRDGSDAERTRATVQKTLDEFRRKHHAESEVVAKFDRWLPALAVKADASAASWLATLMDAKTKWFGKTKPDSASPSKRTHRASSKRTDRSPSKRTRRPPSKRTNHA